MRAAAGLLLPVVIAVGIAAWLVASREPPRRVDRPELSATVRTMIVAPAAIRPVVRGFGDVRAATTWDAVAESGGTVTWRHPDLDAGNIIAGGTMVMQIDPTSYELAVAQAEADLAGLRAEQDQLSLEEANTRRILELEQTRLALSEQDLRRARELVAQGAAPQARADEIERATLQIRRGVAELGNALALVPSRRARLDAQLARTEAVLARARRDVDRTRIVTPFDIRVGQVHASHQQFVPAGGPLISADGIARAEVTAQVPLEDFPRLLASASEEGVSGLAALDRLLVQERIEARLTLVSNPAQTWAAKLARVESALDPRARSVPVVVVVDDPYADAAPPERLPLVPNMYVELTLTGPEGDPVIAVPDHAVRQGDTVLLRDAAGRLELREVQVAYRQDRLAVVASGLSEGDEIVLDDLVPAVPGMVLHRAETGQ